MWGGGGVGRRQSMQVRLAVALSKYTGENGGRGTQLVLLFKTPLLLTFPTAWRAALEPAEQLVVTPSCRGDSFYTAHNGKCGGRAGEQRREH